MWEACGGRERERGRYVVHGMMRAQVMEALLAVGRAALDAASPNASRGRIAMRSARAHRQLKSRQAATTVPPCQIWIVDE